MPSAPSSSRLSGFADHGSALETIGVGFDGSPESRAAAELARDLAAATGARLKVIRILEPPPPGGPRSATTQTGRSAREERRDEVQAELDAVLAELGTSPPARSSSAIPRPSWPTPATTSTCW